MGDFLEAHAQDAHLKLIALERFHDVAALYEDTSTKDTANVIASYPFANDKTRSNTLCGREWAYSLTDFMPRIQKINAARVGLSPIIATSFDGMSASDYQAQQSVSTPASLAFKSCETSESSFSYVSSANREADSSANFATMIWNKLGPNDKAIVVYHIGHLLDLPKTCRLVKNGDTYIAQDAFQTWRSAFFAQVPAAPKFL